MIRLFTFSFIVTGLIFAFAISSHADPPATTCNQLLSEARTTRPDEGAVVAARRVHDLILSYEDDIDAQCRLDLLSFLGDSCEALNGAPLYACADLLEEALGAVQATPYDRLIIQDDVLVRLFKQYQEDGDLLGAEKSLRARRELVANSPSSMKPGVLFDFFLKEGDFYRDSRRLDEAESAYQELLKLTIQFKEFSDLDSVVALGRLSEVYEARGNFAHARTYTEKVIHIIETRDGRESVALVLPLERYARVLAALGKSGMAEEAILRARHLRQE